MSSPPLASNFTFKHPPPRDSPQLGGFNPMSTPYSSSLGRSFDGGHKPETGPDHIIPGGGFEGFSSSPARRSGSQEQSNQPVFGNSSFGYQVSATRSHQQSDSMDSKQGVSYDAPPATYPGMAVTMEERPGSYQPPESHSRTVPSTPVPIPNRGQQQSHIWDARYPPPLSSTSTTAYTNAMTPSTGRQMSSHPTMGFHIKNSFESPPSWHFEATPPSQQHQQQQYHSQPQMMIATPQHVYATPTPVSRRPALLTTPSSVPMAGRFSHLPARRLPGSTSQPHWVLPALPKMLAHGHDLPSSSPPGDDGLSRRPWPSVQNDMFISQYETHFDQNGRPVLKRSPSSRPSKEHRCPTCRKVFARPSALQTHQAVHTGAKPFQCPILTCGKRFSVLSNMRRHVRTHERPDVQESQSGMGHFSSDDYEGNGDESSFRMEEYGSDGMSSPTQSQYLNYQPRLTGQDRSKRRLKQEVDEIPFDSAALGNAAAGPYYPPPGYHYRVP